MSPRKARYEVDKHIVQGIRDRRKKILNGPYFCPACSQEKLRVIISHENENVLALCKCGFRKTLQYTPNRQGIDYYNELFDN